MPIHCVVLDFDGTFTDVRREARPFFDEYPKLLADLFGRDIDEPWREACAAVERESPELGWLSNGTYVAPAAADPYVLATAAARKVCDRLGLMKRSPELRTDVLQALYQRAYPTGTEAAFRPEAGRVLATLLASGLRVHFVTNASTGKVKSKLATLGEAGQRVDVVGDAGKFLVVEAAAKDDPRWQAVPESEPVEGLARPVRLRRGKYFDTLAALWRSDGATPDTTLVCGDVYELDHALPAKLGAHVHLVERDNTYAYERNAIAALGDRGGISPTLDGLLSRVGL